MNKVITNVLRVIAAVGLLWCIGTWFNANVYADIAYADETVDMGPVSDKLYDPNAQEYGAICAMLGGEPELSDVTIQEYLMVCRAWKGHAVLAAERVTDYRVVVDDSYWSGPLTKTETGHVESYEYIVAVDDHGNTFTYHL